MGRNPQSVSMDEYVQRYTRMENDYEKYLKRLGLLEHSMLMDLRYWEQHRKQYRIQQNEL